MTITPEKLRHWAKMASLTDTAESCLSVEQLNAIADHIDAQAAKVESLTTQLSTATERAGNNFDRAEAAEKKLEALRAQEPDGYIFCHPDGKLFWSISDSSNAGRRGIKPFYFHAAPVAVPDNTEFRAVVRLVLNALDRDAEEGKIVRKEMAEELRKVLRLNSGSKPARDTIRQRHAEWSEKTFGPVGPVGPLKHLSAEAMEAAEQPGDLYEWADMQFLLWDAQRRAGISDDEITSAMEEKLKVNMSRQWPEPKDGEPRMHVKAAGGSVSDEK